VVELLFKLRQRYLATKIPISIVLDNAAYQVCSLVQEEASVMSVELIYLPWSQFVENEVLVKSEKNKKSPRCENSHQGLGFKE